MDSYSPKYSNDRFWPIPIFEAQTSELVFGGSRLTHNHHWLVVTGGNQVHQDAGKRSRGDAEEPCVLHSSSCVRWKLLLLRCKSWKNWMAIRTSFACPDPSSIGVGDLKSKNLAPQILAWLIVRCVCTQRNCSNLIMHGLNLESWHQSIGNMDFQKTYWGPPTWLVAWISLASPTGWLIQSSTQDSGMLISLYDLWFICKKSLVEVLQCWF